MNSGAPKATGKNFSWARFIVATICVGILLVPSFIAAFADDEGTLGTGLFRETFARVFYVLRFPTHSLFWNLFSTNGKLIFFLGLFINCMFYGLIIERLLSLFKRKTN